MYLIRNKDFSHVVLNFPGIGAGELREEEVRSVLDQELDERVIVVQRELK
jgi:hypothetical protein